MLLAVNAFILNKKSQVLLVKRSDTDTFLPGFWELPGGGVDGEESPQEALEREIREEVGLSVSVYEPLKMSQYTLEENVEKIIKTEICFLCIPEASTTVTLSHEHAEYRWVSQEEINALFPLSSYIQQVVKTAFAHKTVQSKLYLNS